MKISVVTKHLFAFLFVLLAFSPAASAATDHLLISQVYGGGGNSGATYRYDFVELYNPTSAAVDLSTWSIQYASTTGPSGGGAYAVANLSGTIGAGQYFLIQACIGTTNSTNGALLPTPDYTLPNSTNSSTCSPAIAAAAGKIALVSNQTAVAGPFGTTAGLAGSSCPTVNTAAIVDYVGFGTASTCYAGSGTTPTLSATLSAIRDANNDNTGSNSADFSAATPNPRNSATNAGSSTSLSILSATASPASVTTGTSTTFSVTVKPGSNTTSITSVIANLSTIGGSATQALALSSTPNVYTYTYTVPTGTSATTYSLPVTVTDQTTATANGTISLTVQAPVVVTPIPTLQGNRSTYVGQKVTTTGVVTSVLYNGFFIQLPSSTPGSTGVAEGMDVYTSSAPTVNVGDNITVTGTLQLYPAASASVTPALELTAPAITTNSTGNALPTPIALTTANLTPSGGLQQLTKYEGMRVSFASLTSISGTGGGSLDEVNEIYKSTGQFYATITGTPRPFREPGIDVRDAAAATAPSTVPRFDDNPERILVDTAVGLNATAFDTSSGAIFNNVTGVLDFTYSSDSYYDPSRFIPDTGSLLANYTPGMKVTALPLPGAGQFTVGAYNIERFFNTNSADNLDYYPVSGKVETSQAVTLAAAAYARRLTKVSLAIRHVINNPDILAIEEAENGSVLKDIAAQISADAILVGEPDPKYVAYGTDNSTYYSNDLSGISVGFLVKSTVDFIQLDQFFNKTTFTPTGGSLTTTDDRPPFVLHAGVKRGTGIKDYPITVIVNHMKALPDTTTAVQQKKELQAEELAGLIQGYQAKGEHVLAVGDFNIFEFSDGYIDEMGTVTNHTLPANQVITPGVANLVNPALTDLALNIAQPQRYSYNEDGNAQILDHVVATADIAGSTTLMYGRVDADFPLISYNDATTPARVSDHDPALAYLALPAPVTNATLTGTAAFPSSIIGVATSGQVFTLTNTGEAPITLTSIVATGDFAQSNNCGSSLTTGSSCAINVVFTPTTTGARTGTLTVTSSVTIASVAPVALTGTGLPIPTFTLTDNSGSATTTITVPAGTTVTGTAKFTSLNGFVGSVVSTCTAQGTAPTGATCTVTSPVALAASGTATATVTIATTGRTTATASGIGLVPRNGRMLYALLVVLMAGAVFAVRSAGRKARAGALLAILFALMLGVSGCGSSSSLNATANPNGTPAGTYNYTLTSTSGGMTKTETVVVIVQ